MFSTRKKMSQIEEIGISVSRREGEDIDTMLKRLKKKMIKEDILKREFSNFYEKPSIKKRRKRQEALKRLLREESKSLNRNKKIKKGN